MFKVSVDVGGTFTDLVALDEDTGEFFNIKVPSVPRNPENGVIDALKQFLDANEPSSVRMLGHSTTIAANALFGQIDLELPKTALITTNGFRDVIEIGRQRRAELYNLFFQRPPMLVDRRHRYEVKERVGANGEILVSLNKADVWKALDDIENEGVESLAIGFINSYVNQAHEEEVLRMAMQRLPSLHMTPSSHISSSYREYERFSTAVVNAALKPIIHTYLSKLKVDLEGLGVFSPLHVMQSNGGMATASVVAEKPAMMVESGPASGVIAAAWLGNHVGKQEVISFDMGGTTAKAGTIRGQVPEVVPEYEVAGKVHMGRLLKGSGYPVRFPFLDLAECSAGGGTIAWADRGGAINVGPISAGAHPGPACYGKGGKEPTITDANLTLGRLNPDSLLGGELQIYPRYAVRALKQLGDRVGASFKKAAASVIMIANSIMSKILRIVSVERGFDPRRFTLVAFGGAGPMHACPLADELQIGEVLVPPSPGMFSALGLLTADLSHDYFRSLVRTTDDVDPVVVEELFEEMEAEGAKTLLEEGAKTKDMRFQRQLDLRYLGQSYELSVDINAPFNRSILLSGIKTFHKRHDEIYGYAAVDEPVEVVNLRLRAVGKISKPHLPESLSVEMKESYQGRRLVYFEGADSWIETPIHVRSGLSTASCLEGPAVIEQYDATTVVYPGWRATVDRFGILCLRRCES